MTRKKILLTPEDFDALHLSALANGGIGWGSVSRWNTFAEQIPHCIIGHAAWLESGELTGTHNAEVTAFAQRLAAAGLTYEVNDRAVSRVARSNGTVDFARYVRLLNIDVRTDDK